ncbi:MULTISPECIES: adenylyltransferase/cytidyltransferase family protein [unclassified Butyrivibrio]|jgi:glycerol-3-phosphate cytidylyltransferase|uniref:adenylyltransferase/cytidyltransferase family protein n=1 Tax=unclassified Butyrivibrio TaxID=2639466 RepID=UPI0003B6DD55|nr:MULTISPECIES: adenylyltransferase/cytidyltransferase family protein [unclassified Butyrivibrio]
MSDKKFRIGYTTGVFDLFHIGHLNVLRNAKEQCNYLIVGVSTDELVEEYKHKKPIIPYEERVKIVEAIKYVDEVVPQTSMDKYAAWEKLKYNALFHGDDWKNSAMYNKYIEEFKDTGVELVFLPHTDGTSSTLLTEVLHSVREKENNSNS